MEELDNADDMNAELDLIEDEDAKYDQDKIDKAFPVEVEVVQPLEKSAERPPVVLQKLTISFSNGRVVDFMGAAAMTVDEFRGGTRGFRVTALDFSEPFVVATEDPQKEEIAK